MKYVALTVSEEELPLIKELWLYFIDKYFNSSTIYQNLGLDGNDVMFIRLIVVGLFVGLAIAGFAAVFNKRVLGRFVRRLLAAEAFSPDSAKTLEELGFADDLVIYSAVKRSTSLRRVVKCREEQEYNDALAAKRAEYESSGNASRAKFKETEYKVEPLTDAFYIPEKMKYMADVKFDGKGSTWASAIMSCVLMLVLMVVALVALPSLLEFLNDLAA